MQTEKQKKNQDKLNYSLKTKQNPGSFSKPNGWFYGPKKKQKKLSNRIYIKSKLNIKSKWEHQ